MDWVEGVLGSMRHVGGQLQFTRKVRETKSKEHGHA